MNIHQKKQRREEIIGRELVIHQQLAEMKRAYVVDGIEGNFKLRTTLEAELANLAVEKNDLTKACNEFKTAMKVYRATLVHAHLIRLCAENGLGHLVAEADHLAMQAVGVGVEA